MSGEELKLERVRAFVDAVRKRPNALIRQEGQTLAVADLEALLSALKEAREALKVSEALSSPGGQGNTEAQGCGTDGAVSCRGGQPESPASAAEAVSPWRPIASAPKDGTAILAFCVHPNARYAGEDFDAWTEIVVTRWIDFNGGGWTWNGICGVHTHWMPLPAPPPNPVSHEGEA